MMNTVFALVLVLAAVATSKTTCPGKERCTLIWECQERCSPFSLQSTLEFLAKHKQEIFLVSPEAWQLTSGGKFAVATHNSKPLTDMRPGVEALGFPYFPMLTSANIDDLRTLWANPKSFVEAALVPAKTYKYLGYHVDFEPESGVLASDAPKYCAFIDYFAEELHKNGFILSVDVARWSPLWDFNLLAKTKADRIVTMQSYTTNLTRFQDEVTYTMKTLGDKAVIGMMSNLNGYTKQILDSMHTILRNSHVNEINIWHDNQPFSDDWLAFLQKFLSNTSED